MSKNSLAYRHDNIRFKIRFFIFRLSLYSSHFPVNVSINLDFSKPLIKKCPLEKPNGHSDDVIASTKLVIPRRYTEFNSFRFIRRIASNSIQTFKEKHFLRRYIFVLTIRESFENALGWEKSENLTKLNLWGDGDHGSN